MVEPSASRSSYPLALDVHRQPCVVIGGGVVAERKVRGLLAAGAEVTVTAPRLTAGLRALTDAGTVVLRERDFRSGDLRGAVLAFAATDQRAVNAAVAAEAREVGILVNVADAPDEGNFAVPAVGRRDGVTIGVTTAGESPFVAGLVRDHLIAGLDPGLTALLACVGQLRREEQAAGRQHPAAHWRAALTAELVNLARTGDRSEAEALLRAALSAEGQSDTEVLQAAETSAGLVSLVGAGPGDPGLLTVRALERLRAAEVVVYDRLVDPRLLDEVPAQAQRIYVGKEARRHAVPQAEITTLLIKHGLAGRRVVRLKGGDPFVFGRGGEEAEALAAAGVAFEVVPGVTSAVAVPAYAGIPVTHRAVASSLAIVTGHEDPARLGSRLDWAALARLDTVVFLMSVGSLPRIVAELIGHGREATTPAAAIEWGTWAHQRTIVGTLATLPELVTQAGLGAPTTIVVGEVVGLRERLRWFAEGSR